MTDEVIEPTADEIERVSSAIVLDARNYKSSPRTMARAAILAMDRRASPAAEPVAWRKRRPPRVGGYGYTERATIRDRWLREGQAVEAVYASPPAPAVVVGEPDDKWKRACAAQSRKLQHVLCIPGVKEALTELEWETWTPTPAPAVAVHPDDLAVDRFAAIMKAKLANAREKGRGGWDDRELCPDGYLSQLLREHVDKGDPVDVANLAMMLTLRGERIEGNP